MRSEQTQDFTIFYPSSPAFAFNRNVIKIVSNGDAEYSFKVSDFPKDVRETKSSGVEIDISRYLQLCFSRADILSCNTRKQITISVAREDNGATFDFDLDVMWGGISAGTAIEDSEEDVILEESTDVTLLAIAGFDLFVRNDVGRWEMLQTVEQTGFIALDVSEYIGNGRKVIVQQIQKERSTFDDSFDYTFLYKVLNRHTTTYNVPRCKKGTLVRWIDNFGLQHHRFFKLGDNNIIASNYGETIDDYAMQDYSFGFPVAYQQGFEAKREMTIAVPNATHAEWVVLKSLLTSPCVQYKADDGRWYEAIVKGNTTPVPSKVADFSVTLQLPNIVTQRF